MFLPSEKVKKLCLSPCVLVNGSHRLLYFGEPGWPLQQPPPVESALTARRRGSHATFAKTGRGGDRGSGAGGRSRQLRIELVQLVQHAVVGRGRRAVGRRHQVQGRLRGAADLAE